MCKGARDIKAPSAHWSSNPKRMELQGRAQGRFSGAVFSGGSTFVDGPLWCLLMEHAANLTEPWGTGDGAAPGPALQAPRNLASQKVRRPHLGLLLQGRPPAAVSGAVAPFSPAVHCRGCCHPHVCRPAHEGKSVPTLRPPMPLVPAPEALRLQKVSCAGHNFRSTKGHRTE